MLTLKVLIVDDEPGMRQSIQRALVNYKMKLQDIEEEIRFEMSVAENGEQALTQIAEFKPDILLLDYKLPDMTGLDVLEQFDNKDEQILTIMVTAYASLDTAVSAIKSGAFDFLAKPFTPNELRSTISKAARNLIHSREIKKLQAEKRQVRFQFISVLGHELKSPLGAVEGYLNMIKERTIGIELEKYDNMVDRCLIRTDQMRKLIGDLLEMTKIESGQRQRDLQEINLSELVKTSIESIQPDADRRNITISLVMDSHLNIIADKSEIEIILNNLFSNAVKYNRDNGNVDISIKSFDHELQIIVSDTGIGLSEDDIHALFRDFVRIKNQKTKDILGSGLGLSTVKKIANLYNGDIIVKSTPDIGSIFTVKLIK